MERVAVDDDTIHVKDETGLNTHIVILLQVYSKEACNKNTDARLANSKSLVDNNSLCE